MKQYDKWNEVKKRTDNKEIIPKIRQREIYWANIGEILVLSKMVRVLIL